MARIQKIMPKLGTTTANFVTSASLRTKSEILDETDMAYRIHWAVREAQIHKQSPPANLLADVVMERHYALNWLVWYADEWDDITTDT